MDAETLALIREFYAGCRARERGFPLLVNPHRVHTRERALWQSGWSMADRRMR